VSAIIYMHGVVLSIYDSAIIYMHGVVLSIYDGHLHRLQSNNSDPIYYCLQIKCSYQMTDGELFHF